MANKVADSFVAGKPATVQESFQLQESSPPPKAMDKASLDMKILSKKIQKLHIGLVLGSVLIGSMLFAIVAITIAFSVEISELKSSNSSPDQQQSVGAITDMNILSQLQAANLSSEGIMQTFGSSLNLLSEQFFERISVINNRTQLLNSSSDMLSLEFDLASEDNSSMDIQQLLQDISDVESIIQQVNTSLSQQVSTTLGEVQQTLASFADNQTQVNATLDNFSQQLLQYTALLQQINSSLSQQVSDVENETQQIMSNLLGQLETFPAPSCADINPALPSGYYFVMSMTTNFSVRVYCDMDLTCGGLTGGWQRLVDLDFSNNDTCPGGFVERNDMTLRTCQPSSMATGCISADLFNTSGTTYSRVCGKIIAYQLGTPESFAVAMMGITIDSQYLDGISLTHGSSPREHIWSFAAGLAVSTTDQSGCPCNTGTSAVSPSFVGNDYFCESAATTNMEGVLYPNDPLWDGLDCTASEVPCCSLNNPPWFYKELAQPTFDDIEMRVCRDEAFTAEGTPFENIALYVR